jgi:TrwC relaxase
MTGGEGYAQRHLQQSDYYDQNRTVEGRWCGRGAELLGLKGEVTSEDFEAVRQGLDPQTGEFLRQRHSADRIASNGAERTGNGRPSRHRLNGRELSIAGALWMRDAATVQDFPA